MRLCSVRLAAYTSRRLHDYPTENDMSENQKRQLREVLALLDDSPSDTDVMNAYRLVWAVLNQENQNPEHIDPASAGYTTEGLARGALL